MTAPGTVSVVIPTYNRADVLGKAIDSVLAQTYEDIEVVVVDDASTDGTERLLDEYETVQYYCFEENQGANAARNKGIELAEGEFVAFLDADDYWKPDKLERQLEAFDDAPENCGLVHTAIEIQDFDGATIDKVSTAAPDNPKRRLLLGDYVGTFSSIVVKTEVFETVGDLKRDLPSWQDWEFYLRVADHYGFKAVHEHLTVKRSGKDDQISKNLDTLLETTYPFFESLIEAQASEYGAVFRRRALARLRMEVGDAALVNRNSAIARRYFANAILEYPFEPKLIMYLLVSILGIDAYDRLLDTKRSFRA
ncbi:glycosyltransferase family 2 protein [Halobacterium litoreum]|uniref:Glycosyltransferase family 2 protein n=1 Tax=Halobacterium litoreum TaxID=2039234 RepID=A0ABD5NBG1_9EURY|nr:glycosyltransferase family A protein [Halobacterium litoreum]UHH14734.1 glycosyltransferase family 2 protein [Halobacterium litoreum]